MLSDSIGPVWDNIPESRGTGVKPRLSLTSDVLDFLECQRKYGLYKVRGFASAAGTGEFVGTLAHRSLEQAWRHFKESGRPPSDLEMADILEKNRVALFAGENRRPRSWAAALNTGYRVLRMNRTLAERGIYAIVVGCERVLRVGDEKFVIEGVIDTVLNHDQGVTLWDWKATRDPRRLLGSPPGSPELRTATRNLERYRMQLRLYAHLFHAATGERVASCRAVFLQEIPLPTSAAGTVAGDELHQLWKDASAVPISESEWSHFESKAASPTSAGLFLSVAVNDAEVEETVRSFRDTALNIIASRHADHWPAPAEKDLPEAQTCADCDFRDSCPTVKGRRINVGDD